jgi:lipid II:glycine glycyltransferase (peptidoglycan interpeptide bridge formation enzyme)
MPDRAKRKETHEAIANKGESRFEPKLKARQNCARSALWHSCAAAGTESVAQLASSFVVALDQRSSNHSAVPSPSSTLPEPKTVSLDGRKFEVSWNDSPEDRAWDDFVLAQPDGHHEQTSLWGSVRATLGWTVRRVLIRERGAVIGGAQVQLRTVRRLGRWAYITFGPVVAGHDASVETLLLAELKNFLRRKRALYLLAQLPYDAHPLGERMLGNGFIKAPLALAPSNMKATLLLDLKKSEEQLLAEMRSTTRHQIRQGLKRGLVVEQGSAADLDEFWKLMCALCARRKTTPNPSSPEFFHALWKKFYPRGWMQVFVAKHAGKTVASAVAFPFGDRFRVWKIGWDGAHAELRPNQMLYWTMICAAKKQGCRHFDFVNIEPGEAGGPTEFKLGFGGEVTTLPGVFCHFTNPLVRAGMRGGLVRLLNSERSITLARRLARGR